MPKKAPTTPKTVGKKTASNGSSPSGSNSLTVIDNRTGKAYDIAITDGAVRSRDFRSIKKDEDDFGLLLYDSGLTNTATCRSSITHIDGDKGVLEYRGYPIEQLAEKSTFLETAYLLIHGELPTREQLATWTYEITNRTYLIENVKAFMEGFRYDAHPMGMLVSTVAALSTFYPDAREVDDPESRHLQTIRLIAKMPTIAAFTYRHNRGLPYIYPDNDLTYTGNFLSMLWKMSESRYIPSLRLERAMEVLFILHADHEQNASTNAMRSVGSSEADPYTSAAAAASSLWGPLHGGANEEVIHMLESIGDKKNVPAFVKKVRSGEVRLMGFGHRIYKSYDPRATIIKKTADTT
jgi:citrate synthase